MELRAYAAAKACEAPMRRNGSLHVRNPSGMPSVAKAIAWLRRGRSMDENPQDLVDYYRKKAREIRQLAWQARSVSVRGELFQIAAGFSRMAAHVEAREERARAERSDLDRFPAGYLGGISPPQMKIGGHP